MKLPKITLRKSGYVKVEFSLVFTSTDLQNETDMNFFITKEMNNFAQEFQSKNPSFFFDRMSVHSKVRDPFDRPCLGDPDYVGSKAEKQDYDAPYENFGHLYEGNSDE